MECGFLCADFCVRIFGADFSVRIFRCGFFGADFSVRIFWCGFFGADFCADFCADFFADFFLHGDRRESDKKNPEKNPSKNPPRNPPQNFLSKNPPQNRPQTTFRTFASRSSLGLKGGAGAHLDALVEVGCQSRRFSGNRSGVETGLAGWHVLKTSKPPKNVVCIRPSTWETWCALQARTLAYRHLWCRVSFRLASFNLAKPEKNKKNHKKNPHHSSADHRSVIKNSCELIFEICHLTLNLKLSWN